jgi:Fe2+ transport system protein B
MGQGLAWLKLPPEVSPAILFSILRKDGLFVLNAEGGGLVAALSTGQLLLVIWLASTLTACLVTLWTIRRELGLGFALMTAGRQAVSSLLVAVGLALMI